MEKEEQKKECVTRLLSDLPASKDAFGGHARVARAIATLLMEEEGGKAIALTGAWGSGKSTVVKIVQKQLKKNKDIAIFVFDTWCHERDPLRRSFLEQLLISLKEWGKECEEEWNKINDQLTKRLKIHETTRFPRLTSGGIALTIAALLVPIGVSVLSHIRGLPSSFLWMGFVLAAAPLIVFLFMLITGCCGGKINEEEYSSKKKSKRRDILKLLISRVETKEHHETIETPEPTSIEFQNYFRNILENTLGTHQTRRLVIVIDNLDRIDHRDALSMWSTMRTFFEWPGNEIPEWLHRLWLLVPFDQGSMQRLWSNNEKKKDMEDQENEKGQVQKEQGRNNVSVFLDKTFQIEFRVPPPILSDWKEFFKKQFIWALPNHDKDFYAVYRIFEKKRSQHNRPPTPREIKLFINKLGAYHRIWQDEIPLSIQAWYVLEVSEKLKIRSPETVLLNKELLSDGLKGVIKERDWQKYLAALYFNVDIDKAMQVLLGGEIKDYLSSGDDEKLKRLKEQVEPQSFLTVLEHVIADNYSDWVHEEPSALARAALALKGLKQADLPEWQRIRVYLLEGAIEANWSDLNEEVGQGLIAILERCPDNQYDVMIQAILKHIVEPEAQSDEKEAAQVTESMIIEQWTTGLVVILRAIHHAGHGDLIREHFKIPSNEEFYVKVMRTLAQLNVDGDLIDLIEYFVPIIDADQIINHLATLCNHGEFDESYAFGLQLMLKLDVDWNWATLVQAVRERLSLPNVLELPELKGLLRALLSLVNENDDAKSTLHDLSGNGEFMHHLNYAYEKGDYEAVSLCLIPIIEFVPEGNIQNQQGQAPQGRQKYNQILGNNPPEEIVAMFANEVREFQKVDELLEKAAEASNVKKIVSGVMESLIQQEDAYQHLSSSSVVEHYDLLQEMLSPESLQNLIRQLVKNSDLLRARVDWEFNANLSELYLQILEASQGEEGREAFIKFLTNGLRGLPKETWLEKLNEGDHLIALVIISVKEGISVELGKNLHEALLEHAKEILQDETTPSGVDGDWGLILEGLSEIYKKTFLRDLLEEILKQADVMQIPILNLYGNALLKYGVLQEQADRVIRVWFTQIVDRSDVEEISRLAQIMNEQPKIFLQSEPETQQTFRERVHNAWEETGDEQLRQQLEAIANLVDLELERESSEPERETADSEHGGDE